MITTSMTSKEILSHLSKDEGIGRFAMWKAREWRRLKKRIPKKMLTGKASIYRSKVLNQECIVVTCKQPYCDEGLNIFYKQVGVRGDYYYSFNLQRKDPMYCFSTHFWKRYAERTGTLYAMPSIIAKYCARNIQYATIYCDDNKIVYAIKDGIVLADYDKTRGITHMRTFVSKDMLSQLQREAYRVVDEHRELLDELYSKACEQGRLKEHLSAINEVFSCFTDYAHEIYAQYWEKEEA